MTHHKGFLDVRRSIVSEMTYNVSMGTLNPTIPYLHTSAMEDKINDDYLSGRPFGGTAVMYNNSFPCLISTTNTNTPRCTGGHRDLYDSDNMVLYR